MEQEPRRERDRSQVGIGTLIVFIAMVLVAAIAAGVLIDTAGFLEAQSEQTGEQAGERVSNRLQVVNAVGDRVAGQQVEVINMTVKKAPGSDDIDLNTTTLQFVSDGGVADLIHTSRNPPAGTGFETVSLQDDDSSIAGSLVLNAQTDRARVVLDVGADDLGSVDTSSIGALAEGETATVTLTTQAGSTTVVTLTVPVSLTGKTSVTL